VTTPTGETDQGSITLMGDVDLPSKRIASNLCDIVWRMVMDLADPPTSDGEDADA
jgi:hypothetical protein